MRQFATISGPAACSDVSVARRYSPSTVLVLPTSSTSSIATLPCRLQRAYPTGEYGVQCAIISGDSQKAARIKPIGHASISAGLLHSDVFAANPARGGCESL